MEKPLLCGKTAKDYKFWDNLMHHYKNLYPLYDKKVDFKQYTSVHDGWLFSNSKTLKLHNKVCNFEQAQATEVEKRVNLDNPDWVHPCNRRDERYLEDNHLVLVDLKNSKKIDGARVEAVLEKANIALNKNTIPGDKSALSPGGVRMGAPALTSRGFDEADFETVVELFDRGVQIALDVKAQGGKLKDFRQKITEGANAEAIEALKKDVSAFASGFPQVGVPDA